MLPELIRTYNESYPQTAVRSVTSVRTLCDVVNSVTFSRAMFNQVSKMLHIHLTIPVTTATAERSFSTLRRLKTYLRSTMLQARLNHRMILHIHKDRTDKLSVLDIAKELLRSTNDESSFLEGFNFLYE